MKKILLTGMMFASFAAMQAEDNHLYIYSNAGEKLSWSVPSLQKMTFQDGNIVLTKKDGKVAYTPISTVNRMYVSTPSSEKIEKVGEDLKYSWDGERLQLDARPGTPITVYNVTGTVVLRETFSGDALNLHSLDKGVYIVNVGGQTFKIVKK